MHYQQRHQQILEKVQSEGYLSIDELSAFSQ